MIGRTVGKYRFVEELGRDGASAVFKAIDETLDREVAVKMLNPRLSDTEVMKHFQAEATTLARLHHPDIAGIHEIHRTDSELLLVMELVRGETLEALASRSGPLPPERAAYLVAQVLGALEHAHGAGVVHRDLKPANVTITDQGGIKVKDFGVARVAGDDDATSDGFVLQSPAYMAPERLSGKELDGRADVYSAGVIFYQLLTGHVPFEADTPLDMVRMQLSGSPTPAVRFRSGLPGWCQAILDRALARSPEDRFPTAEVFRRTLLAAITEASDATGAFAAVKPHAAPAPPLDPPTAADPAKAVTPPASPLTVAAYAPPASVADMAAVGVTPPIGTLPSHPASAVGAQTTIVLKKNQFAAIGGLLVALVVAIVVLAVVALRRPAPAVSTAVSPAAAAPATEAVTASAAGEPTPPPTNALPLPGPAPGQPTVVAASPLVLPETTPRKAPAAPHAAKPASDKIDPAPTRVVNTTPFTFDARAVVAEGDKHREKDAVVTVADGALIVRDKGDKSTNLYVVPVGTVTHLTYSNSRQPLWKSPSGPAEAMRVESGAFGFLKGGGRNWFGVRTKDALLVLRVDDEQVGKVTVGLEERTGLRLERLVEPKEP